jgi:hypothetical protein
MPSQLDVVFRGVIVVLGISIVAAVGVKLLKALLGNPIPYETRQELEGKYGHWALETAIAVCPHDDIECIEREAKRLYESRLARGF